MRSARAGLFSHPLVTNKGQEVDCMSCVWRGPIVGGGGGCSTWSSQEGSPGAPHAHAKRAGREPNQGSLPGQGLGRFHPSQIPRCSRYFTSLHSSLSCSSAVFEPIPALVTKRLTLRGCGPGGIARSRGWEGWGGSGGGGWWDSPFWILKNVA